MERRALYSVWICLSSTDQKRWNFNWFSYLKVHYDKNKKNMSQAATISPSGWFPTTWSIRVRVVSGLHKQIKRMPKLQQCGNRILNITRNESWQKETSVIFTLHKSMDCIAKLMDTIRAAYWSENRGDRGHNNSSTLILRLPWMSNGFTAVVYGGLNPKIIQ